VAAAVVSDGAVGFWHGGCGGEAQAERLSDEAARGARCCEADLLHRGEGCDRCDRRHGFVSSSWMNTNTTQDRRKKKRKQGEVGDLGCGGHFSFFSCDYLFIPVKLGFLVVTFLN
jgi:hypothetical protein